MKRALVIICWAVAAYFIVSFILGFTFGLLAYSLPPSDGKDALLKNVATAINTISYMIGPVFFVLGCFGKLPGTHRDS